MKKRYKQNKRDYEEHLAQQAESTCWKGDIEYLYNITRQLGGIPSNNNTPDKDKNGEALTKLEDQLAIWKEHFKEVF